MYSNSWRIQEGVYFSVIESIYSSDFSVIFDADKQLATISIRKCNKSLCNVGRNIFGGPFLFFVWRPLKCTFELPEMAFSQSYCR